MACFTCHGLPHPPRPARHGDGCARRGHRSKTIKRFALPSTDRLIGAAVVLAVLGMLLLVPILATISALAVGLFMISSMLKVLAIALYVVAVVRELRSRRMI